MRCFLRQGGVFQLSVMGDYAWVGSFLIGSTSYQKSLMNYCVEESRWERVLISIPEPLHPACICLRLLFFFNVTRFAIGTSARSGSMVLFWNIYTDSTVVMDPLHVKWECLRLWREHACLVEWTRSTKSTRPSIGDTWPWWLPHHIFSISTNPCRPPRHAERRHFTLRQKRGSGARRTLRIAQSPRHWVCR